MEYFIGIETEGFWKGKTGCRLAGKDVNTKGFAEALVPCYNKIRKDLLRADFLHGSHPGHYESSGDDEGKWIVALDDAIGDLDLNSSSELDGHPLEFVSPKMPFGPNSTWREDVKEHWAALLQIGEVEVDKGCATHVHVSPKPEPWSLEQLKRMAKAVIYFDDAFKIIWAPTRREHELTKSNKRNNYKLKDLGFGACCERIEECANKRGLISLMQSGESKAAQQTRDYAWNFENTEKAIGTIEFRCAPGVTTAAHCLIWVEFGVSFVQAAAQLSASRRLENDYKPDVQGLEKFILEAGVDDMNEKDLLAIVFQDQNNGKGWHEDEEMRDAFDKKIKDLQRSKPGPSHPWADSSNE